MSASSVLSVRRFTCSGPFEENCYLVWPAEADEPSGGEGAGRPCWIIDPGAGVASVVRAIERETLIPQAILLTHSHLDHTAGIPELRENWPDLPIWVGRADERGLHSPQAGPLDLFAPFKGGSTGPVRLLEGGEQIKLGKLAWQVIALPGHTRGGLCFHCPASGDLFTGDSLFAGSIGRTDLPGGSDRTLLRSIRDDLLTLPQPTRVHPGHGPATTIGREMRGNPYLADLTDR